MSSGSVRKRGGKWYYSYEVGKENGQRRRIERVGGDTKAQAYAQLRKELDRYSNGGAPIEFNNMSVHDYFMYWYEQYVVKNLRVNTQKNYLNVINKYVLPNLGIYQLKAVTPASIQIVIDKIGEMGLAKHTVEIIITVIRSAFKMAVFPYQMIRENPANYIKAPKYDDENTNKTREKMKIITLEQYHQILERTPFFDQFYMPLQIAFGTGMRRGEVCGLEWKAIDFSAHTIQVNQAMLQDGKDYTIAPPKTKASYRSILIGDSLIADLKHKKRDQMEQRLRYGKYYHESNFVCTKQNGKPVTPNAIKYSCDKIQRELGFPFNFHSLRHTHATMLLENGANIKEIQARLGHSRIETTMDTYAHVTRKMRSDTVDIFERMMHKN